VSVLQSAVPARFRADKQLVSHDIHTSTYNYKYTFSVEIVPVCKVSGTDAQHPQTPSNISNVLLSYGAIMLDVFCAV